MRASAALRRTFGRLRRDVSDVVGEMMPRSEFDRYVAAWMAVFDEWCGPETAGWVRDSWDEYCRWWKLDPEAARIPKEQVEEMARVFLHRVSYEQHTERREALTRALTRATQQVDWDRAREKALREGHSPAAIAQAFGARPEPIASDSPLCCCQYVHEKHRPGVPLVTLEHRQWYARLRGWPVPTE